MSYVASSIDRPAWIGTLPEDWTGDWLKWSVSLKTERATAEEQERLPYLSNENIESWTGRLLGDALEPVEADSRRFVAGDVLFNKLRPYLAKVFHAEFEGTSSGELLCLRSSNRVLPRYLFYVLISRGFIDTVDAETFGSKMPRADWETVGHQPLPLPPLDTQRRIARFLDEKTARIDALIAKKRALLERLAEKRQALITQAVTKGLDSEIPMQESGFEWLGRVPSHWEIKRLRHLTDEPLKYGANAAAEFDEPGWPRFVRITDIDESGQLREETFRSLPPEIAERFLLEEQDILLARSGATVGKSFMYRESWGAACFAGYLIRVRLRKDVSPRFVYLMLNSAAYWGWVNSSFIQSTIQNIGADKYANLWIALPPEREEQEAIADMLTEVCADIDKERRAVAKSLDLLKEYRSAVITAAVTGQLDMEIDAASKEPAYA